MSQVLAPSVPKSAPGGLTIVHGYALLPRSVGTGAQILRRNPHYGFKSGSVRVRTPKNLVEPAETLGRTSFCVLGAMIDDVEKRLVAAVLWFAETARETVDQVMKGVLPLRYSGIWLCPAPDGNWSVAVWPDRVIPGLENWVLMTEARMRGEPWDYTVMTPGDGRAIREAWEVWVGNSGGSGT